jgi:hypothetical protein
VLTVRVAVASATVFLLVSCGDDAPAPDEPAPETSAAASPSPLPSFQPTETLALPQRVDYVAVGGGAEPASSQVSLEQDLALLRELLGDTPGVVLHAGGAGAASTHEIVDGEEAPSSLLLRLAAILDPRESRRARFRESAIEPDGPSSMIAFEQALRRALDGERDTPLLLYLNGHGDLADVDADNAVLLWGGEPLTAFRLSQLLHDAERPVRVVVTSCYSGGFAELAFAGADHTRGAASADVCGLFATTPDRESSGCDPDPDRGSQEGFALHFLQALAGKDARGEPLPTADVDFDGDGVITLYEAHARARIAGRSLDIPTTTAERWLRESVGDDGAPAVTTSHPSPVELAVVRALGDDLSLGDAEAAGRHLADLEARMETMTLRLEELSADADFAWTALRIGLLERWPILDDAWDPRLRPTVEQHHDAIERYLDDSPAARDYVAVRDSLAALEEELGTLDDQIARVTRLVRAHENIRLEASLRSHGGEALATYERLRACESSPLRPR